MNHIFFPVVGQKYYSQLTVMPASLKNSQQMQEDKFVIPYFSPSICACHTGADIIFVAMNIKTPPVFSTNAPCGAQSRKKDSRFKSKPLFRVIEGMKWHMGVCAQPVWATMVTCPCCLIGSSSPCDLVE